MTSFECYKIYCALKLHFTSEYDYFKYNKKTNANIKSFEKRKDKYFFYKVSKRYNNDAEIEELFVSNFITNPNFWVGEIDDEKVNDNFLKWKKVTNSLSYHFNNDIINIMNFIELNEIHFDDIFRIVDGQHPILLKMVLRHEISLETFIILNKILNFFGRFSNKIEENIIWNDFKKKCINYEPFLNVDKQFYKNLLKNKLFN